MSSDGAYLLETSLGDVHVEWAWNKWVSISAPGTRPVRGQVGGRSELAKLLEEAGVQKNEAGPAAREAWRARPSTAARSGEAEPWGSPWKQRPGATLAVVLVGLAAMGLCIFWLKVSWIAV